MRIGLIDVDNKNFPNLALMKISSWHKSQGDTVEFANVDTYYDILYKSKIFSFTEDSISKFKANKVIIGGSGYSLTNKLPDYIDNCIPNYSLYNCEHAYGFLTRGCPNKCSWCIVPEKEGNIKPYMDIEDFIGSYNSAILMDNNILASNWGIKQIEKIIQLKIKVDFNQGLDFRLIDDTMAKLLSQVKWLHPVRLACDTPESFKYLHKAVENLRWRNCRPNRYFVYCLVRDPKEAMDRVKQIKGLYCEPFCQPYRDFKNNIEPTKWQRKLSRWVNITSVFNSVWWEDYKYNFPL
jgi:hypothetical protein